MAKENLSPPTRADVMLVCPACRNVLGASATDPTPSRCPKCGGTTLDRWTADGKRPLGPVHASRPAQPRGFVFEEGISLVIRRRSLFSRMEIELGQGRLRVRQGLLPWSRRDADIDAASIREIRQDDTRFEGSDDVTITSDLVAVLKDGTSHRLLRGLSPSWAFWLRDLLETRLAISVVAPYRVDP